MRKVITLTGQLCEDEKISDWRQYQYNAKQVKKLYRKAQKTKYSTSNNEERKAIRCEEVHQTYRDYLALSVSTLTRSQETLKERVNLINLSVVEQIHYYIQHAERQIDQINRRVLNEETIPHDEKVFSIFKEHTEWVSTKSRRAGRVRCTGLCARRPTPIHFTSPRDVAGNG